MSEAEKKDIPLRKLPYRDCVLSEREEEGENINSDEKFGLYLDRNIVTVQSWRDIYSYVTDLSF